MKSTRILTTLLVMLTLALAACHTEKNVATNGSPAATTEQIALLDLVCGQPLGNTPCVTAKIKFTVKLGKNEHSLPGSLHMKRDDVIRLQLTALGLFEAARLEFTQDDVLIMDRINKQYIKLPYDSVSFLSSAGINFAMLQSLFWNEVFQPGRKHIDDAAKQQFTVQQAKKGNAIVTYNDNSGDKLRSKMHYSWTVDAITGDIKQTDIEYNDKKNSAKVLWNYSDFKTFASTLFPHTMLVSLNAAKKDIDLNIKLSDLTTNDDWEARTRISSRYKKVNIDQILSLIMSL